MDKTVENCLLLDFYGALLTPRSESLMRLYLEEDMSFSEIAERETITRQGAHQIVARGITQLREAEQKLGFLKQHLEFKEKLDTCRKALSNGDVATAQEMLKNLLEDTL